MTKRVVVAVILQSFLIDFDDNFEIFSRFTHFYSIKCHVETFLNLFWHFFICYGKKNSCPLQEQTTLYLVVSHESVSNWKYQLFTRV